MKFKYFLLSVSILMLSDYALTQQSPTTGGNAGSGPFWRRGGNFNANQGNIFGTQYNSPIYTIAGPGGAADFRMRLNGAFNTPFVQYNVGGYTGINSFNVNRSGYMLLGYMANYANGFLNANFGAYSLLHLNGREGTFVQTGGYRPWMKTGITFTDNNDLSYMGIRKVGTGTDRTETMIAWSDNSGGVSGPDDMAFNFTAGNPEFDGPIALTVSATNLTTPADLDGLHVARFTGNGLFGLGNTFGTNGVGDPNIYVRPQSLEHLSYSDLNSVWSQFTNRNIAINSGTRETASDGFRIGIYGVNVGPSDPFDPGNFSRNGNAFVYNQENRHILFSTNANTNNLNNMNNTQERMRISHISAPTNGANGYEVWNPGGINPNFTRISISHNPANPVTRPLSLLHLGYNTGSILNQFSTDGWRSWMDVGMFIGQSTDNMYVGLKNEGNDRYDAVISWGDNPTPNFGIGPDYLRIIFTSTQTPPFGSGPGTAQDGLEIARYDPTQDANNDPGNPSFGKMGVGDFTGTPVTHKLHVRGNARFEFVPDSTTDYVLMANIIDPSNPNDIDLRKVHIDSLPTAVIDTAFVLCDSADFVIVQNGDSLIVDMSCFIDTASASGIVGCSDVSGASNLLEDSYITLNDFDLYFEDGPDSLGQLNGNRVGIGYDCSEPLIGKLNVDNKSEHVGVYVVSDGIVDVGNWPNDYQTGITSILRNSDVTANPTGAFSPAIYGRAENNQPNNLGLLIETEVGNVNLGGLIFAGAPGVPSVNNTGLRVSAIEGSFANVGGFFSASGAPGSFQSTGGGFFSGGATTNYGIQASAPAGPNNFSGFFQGAPISVVGIVYPSDQTLKTNINDYDSSLYVINQLDPKTFNYTNANYPGMEVETGHQYGLIAQDVEQVLPALVSDITSPAQFDSVGNVLVPAYTYKGLDYEAFIPILIGGVQEQQEVIESQDSVITELNNTVNEQDSIINDLNQRLTNLENCLTNILPILCQMNQQMIQQNDERTQNELRTLINVELTDDNNIVLDQNVPNPFAEQTVINYSIPETVQKAQIHFYNAAGQLIQTVDITDRGLGQLNVYGADLSTGIYTYTLVADGVIVATKKMQKMNY